MSSNTLKVTETEEKIVPSPRNNLTKEQVKFMGDISKWLSSLELGEEEKKYIESEEFLVYRYSYGYGWDSKEVTKFLKNMLVWRYKYKPQSLRIKDLPLSSKCFVFTHGFDKKRNPVVYMIPKNDGLPNTTENKIEKMKHIVYTYERASRLMDKSKKIFQFTLFVDFKDSTLTIDMIKNTKGVFDELGEYYAERVHQILVINPPWTFNICWQFIKPLMPPHVVAKYVVIPSGSDKEIKKELSKYIDEDQLAFYGKTNYSFDKDKELELEKKVFGDE